MHDPMTLAFQFPPHRHGVPYNTNGDCLDEK